MNRCTALLLRTHGQAQVLWSAASEPVTMDVPSTRMVLSTSKLLY